MMTMTIPVGMCSDVARTGPMKHNVHLYKSDPEYITVGEEGCQVVAGHELEVRIEVCLMLEDVGEERLIEMYLSKMREGKQLDMILGMESKISETTQSPLLALNKEVMGSDAKKGLVSSEINYGNFHKQAIAMKTEETSGGVILPQSQNQELGSSCTIVGRSWNSEESPTVFSGGQELPLGAPEYNSAVKRDGSFVVAYREEVGQEELDAVGGFKNSMISANLGKRPQCGIVENECEVHICEREHAIDLKQAISMIVSADFVQEISHEKTESKRSSTAGSPSTEKLVGRVKNQEESKMEKNGLVAESGVGQQCATGNDSSEMDGGDHRLFGQVQAKFVPNIDKMKNPDHSGHLKISDVPKTTRPQGTSKINCPVPLVIMSIKAEEDKQDGADTKMEAHHLFEDLEQPTVSKATSFEMVVLPKVREHQLGLGAVAMEDCSLQSEVNTASKGIHGKSFNDENHGDEKQGSCQDVLNVVAKRRGCLDAGIFVDKDSHPCPEPIDDAHALLGSPRVLSSQEEAVALEVITAEEDRSSLQCLLPGKTPSAENLKAGEEAEDAQKAIVEAGGNWYSNQGRWKNLLNTAADRQSVIRLFGAVLGLSRRAKQDVKLQGEWKHVNSGQLALEKPPNMQDSKEEAAVVSEQHQRVQGKHKQVTEEDKNANIQSKLQDEPKCNYEKKGANPHGRKRMYLQGLDNRKKQRQMENHNSEVPMRELHPERVLHPQVAANLGIPECGSPMSEEILDQSPLNAKGQCYSQGFTAHQIGQLYCMMHEHVQLLLQVYALCLPAPEHQALVPSLHGMLMELIETCEVELSWSNIPFPDFCFHPPFTHPSVQEDKPLLPCLPVKSIKTPAESLLSNTAKTTSQLPLTSSSVPRSSLQSSTPTATTNSFPQSSLTGSLSSSSFPLSSLNQKCSTGCQTTPPPQSVAFSLSPQFPSLSVKSAAVVVPSFSGNIHPASTCHGCAPFESSERTLQPITCGTEDLVMEVQIKQKSASLALNDLIPEQSSSLDVHMMADKENSVPVPTLLDHAFQSLNASGSSQSQWVPVVLGPVQSVLDVAPLALIKDFLAEVAKVPEQPVETNTNSEQHGWVPLFPEKVQIHQTPRKRSNSHHKQLSLMEGVPNQSPDLNPPVRKTMARSLMESVKRQSLALVPSYIAKAMLRFFPLFDKRLYPHKAPRASAANRLLFTDAEDELLAMGLMTLNTNWKAIQRRYLPSKTTHQIYVRQKNQCAGKSMDNPVKEVRQMKASPLTTDEIMCIKQALRIYDNWGDVWKFCLPYRDPSKLYGQWRNSFNSSHKSFSVADQEKDKTELGNSVMIEPKVGQESIMHRKGGNDSLLEVTNNGNQNDSHENINQHKLFLSNWKPNSTRSLLSSQSPVLSDCYAHLHHVFPVFRRPKRIVDAALSTNFVCLENPYEDPTSTLCRSTSQTVQLAPSLPSIKLPLSGHVSGSLDAVNHINPKFSKALPQSLQPFKSGSRIKAPISLTSNASAPKPEATTLPALEKWNATENPLNSQNVPSCGDKPPGQQGTQTSSSESQPVIEQLSHCNLKPTGLVIEVEAANENLPSKKARYRPVPAILQEHSTTSQIVEIPKPARTQKSSKVSWPMTPDMAITTGEAVHHTSLQASDEVVELSHERFRVRLDEIARRKMPCTALKQAHKKQASRKTEPLKHCRKKGAPNLVMESITHKSSKKQHVQRSQRLWPVATLTHLPAPCDSSYCMGSEVSGKTSRTRRLRGAGFRTATQICKKRKEVRKEQERTSDSARDEPHIEAHMIVIEHEDVSSSEHNFTNENSKSTSSLKADRKHAHEDAICFYHTGTRINLTNRSTALGDAQHQAVDEGKKSVPSPPVCEEKAALDQGRLKQDAPVLSSPSLEGGVELDLRRMRQMQRPQRCCKEQGYEIGARSGVGHGKKKRGVKRIMEATEDNCSSSHECIDGVGYGFSNLGKRWGGMIKVAEDEGLQKKL